MPLSDRMRENRALINLTRARSNGRGPLTVNQLYCASVNDAAIDRLIERDLIVPQPVHVVHLATLEIRVRHQYEISDAGERELAERGYTETI